MTDLNTKGLALALKYRPKKFEDLIGQDSISQTLSLALETKRLSHAYLLSGLRGSGKTSTARIFSKALNCNEGPTSKPCDVCENCVGANEGRHIDIIEMDAASSRKIDDIRELIEHTKYHPSMGRYKIFIIDEVHMLTKEAFNALLKTLEEPPPFVKFILATTDPLKLPATILSRTQHFRFKKIAKSDIVHHLEMILNKEGVGFENEALEILARSGGGSLRDTLTLLDQAIIFSKNSVDVVSVTEMLGLVDPEYLKRIFNAIFDRDIELLKEMLKDLENYEAEMVLDEIVEFLKSRLFLSEEIDIRFTPMILERFFKITGEAKSLLGLNSDSSFVFFLLFLKMIEALKFKDIDEMIEELESELCANLPQSRSSSSTKIESKVKSVSDKCEQPIKKAEEKKEVAVVDREKRRFALLLEKIYDRSYECGKCFEESIEFISFDGSVLSWSSSAEGKCKEILRDSYSIIKLLVEEIYGIGVKIKHTPKERAKSKEDENRENREEKSETSTKDSDNKNENSETPIKESEENLIENRAIDEEVEQKEEIEREEKKNSNDEISADELVKKKVLERADVQSIIKSMGIKSIRVVKLENSNQNG